MARRAFTGGGEAEEDDVNMTPLLDIVFIMLIFFIVTAEFVKEPGRDPLRPEAESAEQVRLVGILVAITEENEIYINKEEVDIGEVRAIVEQLRRENPKGDAVIQADEGSQTRYLIEVMEQIRAAGVDEVNVSTEPN
ncbi:MAG: biopolymer transporter ExbD [Pseudomonadota bacterium]